MRCPSCNAEDGNTQPVDLTQIVPGQIVEITLASGQVPLSATEVEVKNFSNQIEVEVEDANGNPVGDDDTDVEIDVSETVAVANPTAVTNAPRRIKRTVHLQTASNGSFSLAGLPHGRATVAVTRTVGGMTSGARRRVAVRPNSTRLVRLRLRPSN